MWESNQKHLQDKLGMVQRSVRRIFGDFSSTSSASALVQKLNLYPLQLRRMSDNNNNDDNEILIMREPLEYTRAWHAVQKKRKEEEEKG